MTGRLLPRLYKPKDAHTAEIKRIWTQHTLRKQGLASRVVAELERRHGAGGLQPHLSDHAAVSRKRQLYLRQGYDAQFDLTRDPEEYSQPPFDGRLRFTKTLAVDTLSKTA